MTSQLCRASKNGHTEDRGPHRQGGSRLNAKTSIGYTALHWACDYLNPAIMKLAHGGADPINTTDDNDALMSALLDRARRIYKEALSLREAESQWFPISSRTPWVTMRDA
jgi:ankyrin repeat protein